MQIIANLFLQVTEVFGKNTQLINLNQISQIIPAEDYLGTEVVNNPRNPITLHVKKDTPAILVKGKTEPVYVDHKKGTDDFIKQLEGLLGEDDTRAKTKSKKKKEKDEPEEKAPATSSAPPTGSAVTIPAAPVQKPST